VLVHSFWGELARALEAGWWSVGAVLALAVAFLVTAGVVARTQHDIVVLGMVFGGPFASFLLIGVLQAVADPTPGCTSDCEGRLVEVLPAGGTFIGWGVGLLTGLAFRAWRRRAST
jgi:hypothetical protein